MTSNIVRQTLNFEVNDFPVVRESGKHSCKMMNKSTGNIISCSVLKVQCTLLTFSICVEHIKSRCMVVWEAGGGVEGREGMG
jgi:hypothetical protein